MESKIKASTLSVILSDSTTVHCFCSVNGKDCNLTLRFDRGLKAMLCGYPETWDVHDVPVDPFNSESPTGSELYDCDGVEDGRIYISADDELEIMRKLKRSVASQFKDPEWKSMAPTKRRKDVILRKIDRAIKTLKAVSNE